MSPFRHLLAASAAALVGFEIAGPGLSLAFFLPAALLDVDHYLYFLARFRDGSLDRALRFFREMKEQPRFCLCVLHTAELQGGLVALAVLTRSPIVLAMAVGTGFHLALDLAEAVALRRTGFRWWSIAHFMLHRVQPSDRLSI